MSNQIVTIPELENAKELAVLTPESALQLKQVFTPFFSTYLELSKEAEQIAVNDPVGAKELRLKLRKIRTGADKARKETGENALKFKKGVDGIYKLLEDKVSPLEDKLEQIEKAEELAEQERKNKIRQERNMALMPLLNTPEEMPPYDLADISEAQFQSILNTFKLAKQARDDAARKIEEERIKAEKAKEEENKRIRAENERLAKEAEIARKEREIAESKARAEREAIEAQARKERQEAEAKMRAEREAKEKLEREIREREMAEKAKIEAELTAMRKAAAAPDKEKLIQFAKSLRNLPVPELSFDRTSLHQIILSQKEKFAIWIDGQAEKL